MRVLLRKAKIIKINKKMGTKKVYCCLLDNGRQLIPPNSICNGVTVTLDIYLNNYTNTYLALYWNCRDAHIVGHTQAVVYTF